ncbi:MAG: hypothetical protein DCO96_10355 [Fluviicola sp. XM-24bin1]|nr:MAG: hypothetical protein DCO96_10355 [Fluviicola sp. XM-24bin1]
MRKILAFLFLGAVLASCGSDYTTDKDEALELKKEQTEELKSYYEEALEIETDFVADEKEILADYGGKEENLIKKAQTKDEDALDALEDLRNLELDKSAALRELDLERVDFDNALRRSISDIKKINDEKDIKSWLKAIEAEDKIQRDLREAHVKKISKLRKD